ncbi:MAG: prolyl hydroxylase family protein [Sphingomonadaceae bacterium]
MIDTTDYRIEIGRAVAERLRATPGVMQVPATRFDIFVKRDFLTDSECDGLIERIEAGKQPSTLMSDDPDPEFRTSDSCNLDPADPLVVQIEGKLARFTGIQPAHGETIQGQRYDVGQQFKPHHDFFFTEMPYWPEQERNGGQRTWTAMVFLNDVEAGGHTFFENAGVKITPRRGNILAWNNLDAEGQPNFMSLHQGMPVEKGLKYIITKWYRERPWGSQAPAAY